MTAYQAAQKIAKALKDGYGEIGGTENLTVLSGERVPFYGQHATKAPAIMWEEGPYEWAVAVSGGEGPYAEEGYREVVPVLKRAMEDVRAAGFYTECENSFTLVIAS